MDTERDTEDLGRPDFTCPKCGSENIAYVGKIADGELAAYKCKDCDHYWEERC